MTLSESYKIIKKSIVAFCPKYVPTDPKDAAPLFPPIIGTGFVADSNGVIVTNDHVVRAFGKQFRPSGIPEEDWGVYALLLYSTTAGQAEIPLEVLGASLIEKFEPGPIYYGPPKPDVAFVHVKVRGLSALSITDTDDVVEGRELATAGFPMGTDALTAPGYVHQVTPTLQRGIVSAVLPFACERPHAFTINVMTQGGASGSPVFDPETSQIVGVLYAGLNDIGLTKEKDLYRIPTNISYVVPAHYIRHLMADTLKDPEMVQPADSQTIDDLLRGKELVNVLEKGRRFEIREIKLKNSVTNAARFTEVEKVRDDGEVG